MEKKKVSVIMPTYNRGYIIAEALDSLRKQTYTEFEVLVIDDGSTDHTEEVVSNFSGLDIHYIKLEENKGANYARNVGIKHAKGEYLAFLDSDNEYHPQNLAIKVGIMQQAHSKTGFVFGSFWRVEEGEIEICPPSEVHTHIRNELRKIMLKANVIDTNTVLIKKECFEKVGGFDEKLRRLQDWDMFGRVLFEGKYEALFCETPLVVNRVQSDSISKKGDLFVEAKNRILEKRKDDYKQYYDSKKIVEEYLFEKQENKGISIYDRINFLFLLDIAREDWDFVWTARQERYEWLVTQNINFSVFKKWILLEEKGLSIGQWFDEHDVKKIGVYGYGYLGKHLIHELRCANVKVEFIVDKNVNVTHENIPVFHELKDLPEAEIIMVSAVAYYEEIEKELKKSTSAQIVSLEMILSGVMQKEVN